MPSCLFFLSWGRGRYQRKASIGQASIRKAIRKGVIRKSGWEGSIGISSYRCEGTYSIRNTSSYYWGFQRSRDRDLMDRGRLLLGGKTSGSSIVKSSLESSLSSSNLLSISKIFSSNLSSLGIRINRSKSSVFSSFSSGKSSIELSLGSSYISSVLNRKGGGNSQEGGNQQFVHLGLFQRIF